MKTHWPAAISAGLLAAVWAGFSDIYHLVTWIGFLGCSTFFAQKETGAKGMLMAITTNLSGVFWGWLIINGSSFFDTPFIGYGLTGIVTAFMCLQASHNRLAFIPGAFIGCCITFAMAADIGAIVPPLLLGAVLGYTMSLLTPQIAKLMPGKLVKQLG